MFLEEGLFLKKDCFFEEGLFLEEGFGIEIVFGRSLFWKRFLNQGFVWEVCHPARFWVEVVFGEVLKFWIWDASNP